MYVYMSTRLICSIINYTDTTTVDRVKSAYMYWKNNHYKGRYGLHLEVDSVWFQTIHVHNLVSKM